MRVSIALSLFAAVCLFGYSTAATSYIRCYVCTSAQEGCTGDSVDSKYAAACPRNDDFGNLVQYCSKMIIAEANVTMRGCTAGCQALFSCDHRSSGCQQQQIEHLGHVQTECRCSGNLCNAGHSLRAAVPLGVVLLFTVVLRKLL